MSTQRHQAEGIIAPKVMECLKLQTCLIQMHDFHFGIMGLRKVQGKFDRRNKVDGWRDAVLLVVSGTKSLHVVSVLSLWDEPIFVIFAHITKVRSLHANGLA